MRDVEMPERLQRAFELIDGINAQDPRQERVGQGSRPQELLYSERLTAWVQRLDPQASEALLLAARSQHIGRWQIPRSQFPVGRAGYLKWRQTLAKFHADKTAEILRQLGYDEEIIVRVRVLNLKGGLGRGDPGVQTLEDALCLVFLEFQFVDLARKHAPEKMHEILQKTWAKMSPRGRELALTLPYGPDEAKLLQSALVR